MGKQKASVPAGIYLHVPFCVRKCPYCDFYSLPFTEDLADAYVEAVLRAIKTQPYGPLRADTLYLGGGTPSLLGPGRLDRILRGCVDAFGLDEASEITLEANPGAVTKADLQSLRRSGFNRISFGVQSAVDTELKALGRIHSSGEAKAAIEDAFSAGFDNLSADLMLGISGQTEKSLTQSIAFLTALEIPHISAYLLKIEPDTAFGRSRDTLQLPDEDQTARLYLQTVEQLEARGLHQYEISNFARDGFQSRHNLKYWRCRPYLGIGPAAHSYLNGKRFRFPGDLDSFLIAANPFDLVEQEVTGGDWEEAAMLQLRLTEGLDLAGMEKAQREELLRRATMLQQHGLVRICDNRVSLTPQGFLLSNSVTAKLLWG